MLWPTTSLSLGCCPFDLQLVEERDELKEALHTAVCSAQQKTGFQGLLLQRKLVAMRQDIEKTVRIPLQFR